MDTSHVDVESLALSMPCPRLTAILEEPKENKPEERDSFTEIIDIQAQIENRDNWEPKLEEFNIGSQGIQIVRDYYKYS